jgi:hypothetical protein
VRNSGSKDEKLASKGGNGIENGDADICAAAFCEESGEIAGMPPDPPEIGRVALSNGIAEVPESLWASASLGNLPMEGTEGIDGNGAPN